MRRRKTLSAVRDIANIRYLASVRALNKIIRTQRRANEALCGYDLLMGLFVRLHGEQKYKFGRWISKLRVKDIRRFHVGIDPFPFVNLNGIEK